jgi:hypothetical protein
LDEVLSDLGVDEVTLIKIDVEGADFLALQSFDFSKLHPELIMVEFMDSRSLPNFGYTHHEMVSHMKQLGYSAFISEWAPINEYAHSNSSESHKFLQCVPYTPEANPAWGNVVFVSNRRVEEFQLVLARYLDDLKKSRKIRVISYLRKKLRRYPRAQKFARMVWRKLTY